MCSSCDFKRSLVLLPFFVLTGSTKKVLLRDLKRRTSRIVAFPGGAGFPSPTPWTAPVTGVGGTPPPPPGQDLGQGTHLWKHSFPSYHVCGRQQAIRNSWLLRLLNHTHTHTAAMHEIPQNKNLAEIDFSKFTLNTHKVSKYDIHITPRLTLQSPTKVKYTVVGHKDRVNSVRWIRKRNHASEDEFVSSSTDKTCIVWKKRNETVQLMKVLNYFPSTFEACHIEGNMELF